MKEMADIVFPRLLIMQDDEKIRIDGMPQHWYMIGEHEVSCDSITELESQEEDDDESDTI